MLFDKVIAICLNPSLDLTLWVDKFDLNEPVNALREETYAGGKAINVARVLTSLGVCNCAIAIVGDENHQKLSHLLEKEGVSFRFTQTSGAVRENLSIVLPDQQLYKINRQGFNVDAACIENIVEAIEHELCNTQCPLLVFAGSLPRNMTPDEYKSLILKFTAKGIKVCLDTDIFSFADIEQIRPFIIKPNHIELSHIAMRELNGVNNTLEFAKTMTPFVEHILVSVGGEGLIYVSSSEQYTYIPPVVTVKSTVGAGDTTLAGFICGYCNGKSTAECVRYAGACGTASVTLEGTSVINKSVVNNILRCV